VALRDPSFVPFFYARVPNASSVRRALRDESVVVKRVFAPMTVMRTREKVEVIRVEHADPERLSGAASALKRGGYAVYDEGVDVVEKYVLAKGLRVGSWIDAEVFECDPKVSKLPREYVLGRATVLEDDAIPETSVLCFDIECQSHNEASFPDPYDKDAFVYLIGVAFKSGGEVRKMCLYLEKENNVLGYEGAEMRGFPTEVDLIFNFFETINELDPDVITGYNILSFDFSYIWKRLCYMTDTFFNFSRFKNYEGFFRELEWSSSAYGTNEFYIPSCFGRVIIDAMQYVKRELRLAKYSLNYVSEKLFGKTKLDLSPARLFAAISAGDLPKVAEYCLRDVSLTLEIFDSLNVWYGCVEMSRLTDVRIEELYTRGESRKILMQLYRECSSAGILMDAYSGPVRPLRGATVMEPELGLHGPCVSFDFSSLYPSIVISENICYTTYDKSRGEFSDEKRGVVPRLLESLLGRRKKYKGLLRNLPDGSTLKMIYDKRQNALKVCANSVYGCFGTSAIKTLYFPEAAQKVTSTGRFYLGKAKALIETEYDAKVLYGDTDSCMVDMTGKDASAAERLAGDISARFPPSVELNIDSAFDRILFVSKKRYAGLESETKKIKVKGLVSVRSDTCDFIRRVNDSVISKLLRGSSKSDVTEYVEGELRRLRGSEVDVGDLRMSTTLRADYATESSPGAAFKIASEEKGRKYLAGSKIEYVVVASGDRLQGRRWRDVEYYDGREPIDFDFYETRLRKSLSGVISVL
jgi:DNA polymerase elongation subunit (family B)